MGYMTTILEDMMKDRCCGNCAFREDVYDVCQHQRDCIHGDMRHIPTIVYAMSHWVDSEKGKRCYNCLHYGVSVSHDPCKSCDEWDHWEPDKGDESYI